MEGGAGGHATPPSIYTNTHTFYRLYSVKQFGATITLKSLETFCGHRVFKDINPLGLLHIYIAMHRGYKVYYTVHRAFCQVIYNNIKKYLTEPLYSTIILYMTKELTVKQKDFLDYLVDTGGDPKKAAELAGYAQNGHWQVVKALKHEIIDLASNILAQSAPQAAMKLVEVMHSDQPIPQANMRLQAAQTILDRTGLGKQERLEVNNNMTGGLFILPAKANEAN